MPESQTKFLTSYCGRRLGLPPFVSKFITKNRFHWVIEKYFSNVPSIRLNLEIKAAEAGYPFVYVFSQ